jgi:hypothetical protein
MLIEAALGLVERDRRQFALLDAGDEVRIILEMLLAIARSRREAREIVERLVVRLEVGAARGTVVDDLPLLPCSNV